MKLVLVRHLAPDLPAGLCYGRLDAPLSAAALRRVPVLAAAVRAHTPGPVWSSPAARCRVLAEAIAAPGPAPRFDPRLRELHFGAWEARPWDSVPRADLDRWAAAPLAFAPPGGESGAALLDRVSDVWAALRGEGRDCIVVSHGGPLRILIALARGQPADLLAPSPPIGSVTVVAC